ncbi:HlyD family secretion protein [Sulfitobacter undariae]|uniref:HlyD family secretion protein n=1 Tax=Sulfitobacter undariae TaxID=1563671 RepID=A0A7W6E9R7_9RHOB|nr:HlyD family efflux transporter periplasmic adaptor subunit [Sulfitobacter undariae]MBB3994605.1 HlyD family secretion protein [Sulfitobacter undariae]
MIYKALLALCLLLPAAVNAQETQRPWIAVATGKVDIDGGVMRLAARREGLIAEVLVTEGQALARIDDSTARLQMAISRDELRQADLQMNLATLRVEQAQAEVSRLLPLVRADAIPLRQSEEANWASRIAVLEATNAQISVDLVKRRLALQEQEIEAHVIRAPQSGVILRSSARVGDGTSTSTVTEMFLLAPDANRVVLANLDEQFVGLVKPGQSVEIISEKDRFTPLSGEVLRVAGVYGTPSTLTDTDVRTVQIVVRIDASPEIAEGLILGQRMVVRVLR